MKETLCLEPDVTSTEATTSANHDEIAQEWTLSVHKVTHRICVDVRMNVVRYRLSRTSDARNLKPSYPSQTGISSTVSSHNMLQQGGVIRIDDVIRTRQANDVVFRVRLELRKCQYSVFYSLPGVHFPTHNERSPLLHNLRCVELLRRCGIAPHHPVLCHIHGNLNRYGGY